MNICFTHADVESRRVAAAGRKTGFVAYLVSRQVSDHAIARAVRSLPAVWKDARLSDSDNRTSDTHAIKRAAARSMRTHLALHKCTAAARDGHRAVIEASPQGQRAVQEHVGHDHVALL